MRSILALSSLCLAVAVHAAPPASSEHVKRGRYLVIAAGCADCHTPLKLGPRGPEPDAAHAFAGHPQALSMPAAPALPPEPWAVVVSATNTAWAGPWGVSYTANLTPDPDTGLGNWSEKDFVQTLRSGRHLGVGRPLLPPMPNNYAQMSDADLQAMFAYLKTVPAVRNRVPAPVPARH